MKYIQDIQPPQDVLNTISNPTEQEKMELHLIDSAWKVLYLHYSHYNWIDQKTQRFLTIMAAVEWYVIINFFLNWKFTFTDISWFIMLVALLIGVIVIFLFIFILQSRPFYYWPDILAQSEEFLQNWKQESLVKDTLETLNISYSENIKIINLKTKLFKWSVRWMCIFFVVLAYYFAVLKDNVADIPNDILLWANLVF